MDDNKNQAVHDFVDREFKGIPRSMIEVYLQANEEGMEDITPLKVGDTYHLYDTGEEVEIMQYNPSSDLYTVQLENGDEKNIDTLYGLYQLDWMASHGHTLENMINQIEKYDEDSSCTHSEAFRDWQDEYGFPGGEIWVCKDEFIDCELRDTSYMKSLIKNYCNQNLEKWFKEFQSTSKKTVKKAPAGR